MPRILWKYGKKSHFVDTRAVLVLDCDTDLDISVVAAVNTRLINMGIKAIYAVPGELIIRGLETYRSFAGAGHEFINHGYFQHSTVDQYRTRYENLFFYNEISEFERRDDILRGHNTIVESLKVIPKGFRTPHFGTFQNLKELTEIHSICMELKYVFSSSTTPKYRFMHGEIWCVTRNFFELPTTGAISNPLGILDSFSYRFNSTNSLTPKEFSDEISLLKRMLELGRVQRVNIYADPSQVYDWDEFFESLATISKYFVDSFDQYINSSRPVRI